MRFYTSYDSIQHHIYDNQDFISINELCLLTKGRSLWVIKEFADNMISHRVRWFLWFLEMAITVKTSILFKVIWDHSDKYQKELLKRVRRLKIRCYWKVFHRTIWKNIKLLLRKSIFIQENMSWNMIFNRKYFWFVNLAKKSSYSVTDSGMMYLTLIKYINSYKPNLFNALIKHKMVRACDQ